MPTFVAVVRLEQQLSVHCWRLKHQQIMDVQTPNCLGSSGRRTYGAHGARIAVACYCIATYLPGFLRDDATMFDKFLYTVHQLRGHGKG